MLNFESGGGGGGRTEWPQFSQSQLIPLGVEVIAKVLTHVCKVSEAIEGGRVAVRQVTRVEDDAKNMCLG